MKKWKVEKSSKILFFVLVLVTIFGLYEIIKTNHEKTTTNQVETKQIEERSARGQEEDSEVGQNATVSSLRISERKTGTWAFDKNDEPGNDSSENNDIVRSFDTIKYSVRHDMQLKQTNVTEELQTNARCTSKGKLSRRNS